MQIPILLLTISKTEAMERTIQLLPRMIRNLPLPIQRERDIPLWDGRLPANQELPKKQSLKNSVIINFMKTFNIIIDGQEDMSIDFND